MKIFHNHQDQSTRKAKQKKKPTKLGFYVVGHYKWKWNGEKVGLILWKLSSIWMKILNGTACNFNWSQILKSNSNTLNIVQILKLNWTKYFFHVNLLGLMFSLKFQLNSICLNWILLIIWLNSTKLWTFNYEKTYVNLPFISNRWVRKKREIVWLGIPYEMFIIFVKFIIILLNSILVSSVLFFEKFLQLGDKKKRLINLTKGFLRLLKTNSSYLDQKNFEVTRFRQCVLVGCRTRQDSKKDLVVH